MANAVADRKQLAIAKQITLIVVIATPLVVDILFTQDACHEECSLQLPDSYLSRKLTLSSAARRPFASFSASSFAQKCMKNRRGSSYSMWLCSAVTSMPFDRSAASTGVTSFAVRT